jgi:hypothetical protein
LHEPRIKEKPFDFMTAPAPSGVSRLAIYMERVGDDRNRSFSLSRAAIPLGWQT